MKAHTIGAMLRERAASSPDVRYVKFDGKWLSVSDVDLASDLAAAGLASLGVEKGDRIGFFLANCEELIILFYACAKLGAVYVPLNIYLKGSFLEYQLDDAGISVLVVDDDGLNAASPVLTNTTVKDVVVVGAAAESAAGRSAAGRNAVSYQRLLTLGGQLAVTERAPRELAAILYTSGTTGAPKGCMLPDGYFAQLATALIEAGWTAAGDCVLTSFPMFHVSAIGALLSALVCEASVCFQTSFSASTFMATAKAEGATTVWGVGAMASAILAQPPSPTDADYAMRMALWVPLSVEQQQEFERRFNTPVLSAGYGQTEVSPLTMSSLRGPHKPGSAGRCVSYLEVAVVDDEDMMVPADATGEIVVRPSTPNAFFFQGYWNNPQATVAAFRNLWHHTGDYGSIDAEGFVTFVDRKKDSVRRRGENVSSFEVEAAIMEHPAVQQVAITAVSSPIGEDDIRASIVTRPCHTLVQGELFGFFCDRLPYFAIPRYVDIRESLPVNALNKVMKHLLREEGLPATTWDFEQLGFALPRDQRRGSRGAPSEGAGNSAAPLQDRGVEG